MTDVFDRKKRSEIMSSVRGIDTSPEIMVRSVLHRLGFRFRLHREDLPGKPDIVLPKHSSLVLVHGCFWHGHKYCSRAKRPKSNTSFWSSKLDRNLERDKKNILELRRLGWQVLVVWECETKNSDQLGSKLLKFLNKSQNYA